MANICRGVARYGLLFIGSVVFLFSLVSGSEDYGGGFSGLVKNSPNALPWLVLLVLLYIAWKKEILGGILILLVGIFLVIFFNNGIFFNWTTFFITLSVPFFGLLFISSNLLRRRSE